MARKRYVTVGLASAGLVTAGLLGVAPAYAGGWDEVDGEDCLKHDDDDECKSRTKLDADEKKKDDYIRVKLTADVDFFQEDDHNWSRAFGWDDDDDLGSVKFQVWDDDDEEWRTFHKEDVDEDGEADVKVKIRKNKEYDVRAKYSGVDDEIDDSKSKTITIGEDDDDDW